MIRYPVSRQQLEALISAVDPKWLTNAAARTQTFRTLGKYEEGSANWSPIKKVYMALQGNGKCAFCERKLESIPRGLIEQDVEHFRPKSSVKPWAPIELTNLGLEFSDSPAAGGYFLLPYHIFNYAASCKPCNSTIKSDRFPIRGEYDLGQDDVGKLKSEKPYLIYPISDLDDDPEVLIEFYGTSPRPRATSKIKKSRALVTIVFFELGDPEARKNLFIERAMLIMALFPLLKKTISGTQAQKAAATAQVNGFLQPGLAHLNCAKSFRRLFEKNPVEAEAVYDAAVTFRISSS